jgi:hypothetical protein
MPTPGSKAWALWHLRFTFPGDDAAIIECLSYWRRRDQRLTEYAIACHFRKWQAWQASLAWGIVETLAEPIPDADDDIPF